MPHFLLYSLIIKRHGINLSAFLGYFIPSKNLCPRDNLQSKTFLLMSREGGKGSGAKDWLPEETASQEENVIYLLTVYIHFIIYYYIWLYYKFLRINNLCKGNLI